MAESFIEFLSRILDRALLCLGTLATKSRERSGLNMSPNSKSYDSGSALVEATIVLPALIFMIVGMLNLGLMFGDYLFMSQIGREVAARGARMPYLSLDGNGIHTCSTIPPDVLVAACADYAETGTFIPPFGYSSGEAQRCGHTQLCFYGQRLASTKRMWTVGNSVSITTQIATNATIPSLCTVTVTVNGTYSGVLTMFKDTPMNLSSMTGYISEPYTCA